MRKRTHRAPFSLDPWTFAIGAICLVTLIPIAVVLSSFFDPADDVWRHLWETQMARLIWNTTTLLIGVLAGTFVIGAGSAWLVSVYAFPGRKWLEWAMTLPFAFPTYVLGYVMLDIFHVAGPVQTTLRDMTGANMAWFPNIRSAPGVIAVLSLSFYPYVYLLARVAFRTQGQRALEVARSLGCSLTRAFFKVSLPMARPWLFGGLLLVSMETLADFGTVSIFNYDTFTTAIYKAWYSFFSLAAAARLAGILLLIALLLLGLEKWSQSRKRYYQVSAAPGAMNRTRLHGWRGWTATLGLIGVLFCGFILPMAHLIIWTVKGWGRELETPYLALVGHTLLAGVAASLLLGLGALVLAYGARAKNNPWTKTMVWGSTMGYALPGTVLAVGVYIPLAKFDGILADFLDWGFGVELDMLINGTVFVMIAAYFVRFLSVAYQPVQTSLARVRPVMDEAARGLGHGRWSILTRIHFPLVRSGLFTAMLLTLIDVMKEMPITLMTRPFGWDTLSIRIFELTSEGEYERAALPSILLVLTGLIPVIILSKYSNRQGGSEP